MAWTDPLTWVSQNVTAALFNTHLRDNLNETAPGIAAVAGRMIVTDGVNSIVERIPTTAVVVTSETRASATFGDLATAGPAVTVSTGTSAFVIVSANLACDTVGRFAIMSHAVTGATTLPADDAIAVAYECPVANAEAQMSWLTLRTDLTAGSNTFTAKYRIENANIATFHRRNITVLPL